MGNRSITVVKDKKGNKIIEMYKLYDGYPEGLGRELVDFTKSGKLVNGIGSDKNVFNGISCFSAQLVNEFKEGVVFIYMHQLKTIEIKRNILSCILLSITMK